MNQEIADPEYFSNQSPPRFSGNQQGALSARTLPDKCIVCSYKDNVTTQTYKKDYYPPAAYLSILIAPLVGILVLLVFRSRYELPLPFCNLCWKKFRWAERFEALILLSFFLLIIVGVVLLLNFDSVFLLIACPVIAIGFMVWAKMYKSKSGPKIKKINRKKVVISSRAYGDIVFSKAPTVVIESGF